MFPVGESYIRSQFELFGDNLLSSINGRNKEYIHNYRIAAKRIQTITRLAGKWKSGNDLQRKFRQSGIMKMFKSGGRIREIVLIRQNLRLAEAPLHMHFPSFARLIARDRRIAAANFENEWAAFSYERFFNLEFALLKIFRDSPEKKTIRYLKKFIGSRLGRIMELIDTGRLNERLHLARKYLKDLKYCMEFRDLKSEDDGKIKLVYSRINYLEDQIGLWHDNFIFSRYLDQFSRHEDHAWRSDDPYAPLQFITSKRLEALKLQTAAMIRKTFTEH